MAAVQTIEAQDANLEMLVGWIRQYEERTGEFSLAAHTNFYERYQGEKTMYKEKV